MNTNNKLVTLFTLGRGSALVDLALEGKHFEPSVSDLIGTVAAYIAKDRCIDNMVKDLKGQLGTEIAEAAAQTFNHYLNRGGGLWRQGPAYDDIEYLNKTMTKVFGPRDYTACMAARFASSMYDDLPF